MKVSFSDQFFDSLEYLTSWRFKIKDYIYRLKCWLWKRYTTVKPRYLDHTYCDPSSLLVHTSFELLLRFHEGEMYENYVDWEADPMHILVRDSVEYLVDWYENDFVPYDNWENKRIIYSLQPEPINSFWDTDEDGFLQDLEFANEDDELLYLAVQQAAWDYETRMMEETEDNLKLLAEIRPFLWT